MTTWLLGPLVGILTLSTVAAACPPGTFIARFRPHTQGLYSKLVTDNKHGNGVWVRVRAKNPTPQRVWFSTVLVNCQLSGTLEPGAVKTRRCFAPEESETGRGVVYQVSHAGGGVLYSGRICQAHPDRRAMPEETDDELEALPIMEE